MTHFCALGTRFCGSLFVSTRVENKNDNVARMSTHDWEPGQRIVCARPTFKQGHSHQTLVVDFVRLTNLLKTVNSILLTKYSSHRTEISTKYIVTTRPRY